MFLELPTKDYNMQYALYKITDTNTRLIDMNVISLRLLSTLEGMREFPKTEKMFLTILETNVDRVKLANKALLLCHEKGRNDLKERINTTVQHWQQTNNKNAVRCIETGEEFSSAAACAETHDLTYNALIRHLNNVKSYNTVKGKTYERIIL